MNLRKSIVKAAEKTSSFFKKDIVHFTKRIRVVEQGSWVTRLEAVKSPQRAGKLLVAIEISPTGDERRLWVTETTHGLEKVWINPEAEQDGDVGDYEGTLTPTLWVLRAAVLAFLREDFELYNSIIILLGRRADAANYMFRNQYESGKHDFNIEYYRNRFGEDDRWNNLTSGLKRAHQNALYPHITGKVGTIAPTEWLFNADYDRDDRTVKDYDGGENVYSDPKQIPLAERLKRQMRADGANPYAFISKHKGERIARTVPQDTVEVLSAWHLRLVPLKADEMNDEYFKLICDEGVAFEKEDGTIGIHPVVIMGGNAMYYTKEQWQAMKPFRSDAEEHAAIQDFFTHENGEEKFGIIDATLADAVANTVEDKIALFREMTKSMKMNQLHKTLKKAGFDFIEGKTRKTIFENLKASLIG